MNRYRNRRNMRKIVTEAMLCALLLTGCGKPSAREAEQERGDAADTGALETIAFMPETTEESSAERSAERVLARLVEDEGFRDCVRYAAGIDSEDTEEMILHKLDQCEELVLREPAGGSLLHSLEALSYLPNLKSLVIDFDAWDDSWAADLTPIAGLSKLEKLSIENHAKEEKEETDLSFLAEMTHVTELYLSNCQIKETAFLRDMQQLERLSLYETEVEDMAVLENLQGLVELALSGNSHARNMEAVGKLVRLQELELRNCGIRDIGFLSELTQLHSINLNNNFITDLTPLAGLIRLERLALAENQIRDISPLESLAELFDLTLDGNEISDISALSGLAHLNQAGLSDNGISDLAPLAGKEELMFASVFGNPCTDLQPVWEVPLLSWKSCEAMDGKREYAEAWIEKEHPEVTEYTCIDYAEGDLNNDDRKDIAFVIDGTFGEQKNDEVYADNRRLYVLLQQEDGSMQEMTQVPHLSGGDAGGMRGDPYLGIFMGDGYLMLKEGWGSSTGMTVTQIYCCREGKLELAKSISVGDSRFADGYDVTVTDVKNDTWFAYAVAMDGFRMVRVDLANSEHPFHKAFPRMNLYDASYSVYDEKADTDMTAEEALEHFMNAAAGKGEKEDLPYEAWQKTGYELLKGVELPDYYYAVPGTEETAQEETDSKTQAKAWEGDYIYYDGLTVRDGQLYHVICYRTEKECAVYLLNDDTGEIQEE
ncbi:MAG: leucine-rich repeat domain-containing protein [Lachnospiraceae bacterium]|nr:leucine-rich repeat domain-containing protein [Lachnospiraceae bacterium]